jgi:hypothetical protein
VAAGVQTTTETALGAHDDVIAALAADRRDQPFHASLICCDIILAKTTRPAVYVRPTPSASATRLM